ncbi:hypothetical protein B0H17DRAFT_1145427 [Mycena rosella]|uniref:Uncharacterized protein n=1 Tax=Mycena rosella TaxID=1033263 RepID=A0AAD7CR88_MYCRO|nr:hypothetical protein B0H17DRAFT_1145427 [Mycena rosella]
MMSTNRWSRSPSPVLNPETPPLWTRCNLVMHQCQKQPSWPGSAEVFDQVKIQEIQMCSRVPAPVQFYLERGTDPFPLPLEPRCELLRQQPPKLDRGLVENESGSGEPGRVKRSHATSEGVAALLTRALFLSPPDSMSDRRVHMPPKLSCGAGYDECRSRCPTIEGSAGTSGLSSVFKATEASRIGVEPLMRGVFPKPPKLDCCHVGNQICRSGGPEQSEMATVTCTNGNPQVLELPRGKGAADEEDGVYAFSALTNGRQSGRSADEGASSGPLRVEDKDGISLFSAERTEKHHDSFRDPRQPLPLFRVERVTNAESLEFVHGGSNLIDEHNPGDKYLALHSAGV